MKNEISQNQTRCGQWKYHCSRCIDRCLNATHLRGSRDATLREICDYKIDCITDTGDLSGLSGLSGLCTGNASSCVAGRAKKLIN